MSDPMRIRVHPVQLCAAGYGPGTSRSERLANSEP
eukprot:gene2638-1615_t